MSAKAATIQDGMILVYKPPGMPSKDISRWFQRKFGRIKMGHVGTLDPIAEGLLPMLFGRATRLQDFLLQGTKSYEFDVVFGRATDTMDADGETVAEADVGPLDQAMAQVVCDGMVGAFEQIPPLYSAIKFQGKPLYEYARQGKGDQVPLQDLKKQVQIFELRCLSCDGEKARFQVRCSKGTYVRVLACHIAERLGTLGTVIRLVRLASGDFHMNQAVTLEDIEQNLQHMENIVIPIHSIKLGIPTWRTNDEELLRRLRMGQEMHVEMKCFETGLAQDDKKRSTIRSLDHMVLIDNNGQSFGIGSAQVLNTGRIAVRMRRGLS